MTDWGAVDDRVQGIRAGLDLEMPASNGENDRKIVEAVQSGMLDEKACGPGSRTDSGSDFLLCGSQTSGSGI
jgi:hypothetical protein